MKVLGRKKDIVDEDAGQQGVDLKPLEEGNKSSREENLVGKKISELKEGDEVLDVSIDAERGFQLIYTASDAGKSIEPKTLTVESACTVRLLFP